MLTDQDVKDIVQRRERISGLGSWVSLLGICFILMLLGVVKEPALSFLKQIVGNRASSVFSAVSVTLIVTMLFVPLIIAGRQERRLKIVCPSCHKDANSDILRLQLTRCCSKCGNRLVHGGHIHSNSVLKRWARIWTRTKVASWFWCFPVYGMLKPFLSFRHFADFHDLGSLLAVPLLGVLVIGTTWLCTRDRRYVPALLASAFVALLVVGIRAMVNWLA